MPYQQPEGAADQDAGETLVRNQWSLVRLSMGANHRQLKCGRHLPNWHKKSVSDLLTKQDSWETDQGCIAMPAIRQTQGSFMMGIIKCLPI